MVVTSVFQTKPTARRGTTNGAPVAERRRGVYTQQPELISGGTKQPFVILSGPGKVEGLAESLPRVDFITPVHQMWKNVSKDDGKDN